MHATTLLRTVTILVGCYLALSVLTIVAAIDLSATTRPS